MTDWEEPIQIENQTMGFFLSGMRNLWSLLGKEKNSFKWVIICQLLLTTLSLSWPYCIKIIFDELPTMQETQIVSSTIIAAMIGVFIIKAASLSIRQFVKERIFLKSVIRLENSWPVIAQDKLLSLSLGYHARENTGKKIAKVNKGVDKMVNILCNLGWGLLPHSLYLIINVVIILIVDAKLGILFMLPFGVAIVGNLYIYKLFAPKWEQWEKQKEKSNGVFCQSIINVATVQAYVQENRERQRLGSIRSSMSELDIDISLQIQFYFWLIGSMLHLSFVSTLAIALYFVYRGSSTPGTIVYLITTGNVTLQSVWEITNIYTRIMRDLVAVERMKELLDEEPEIVNIGTSTVPAITKGVIQFEDVDFVYPGKTEPTLSQFSMTLPKGKMIALVGKSGEGKSTIVKLLNRMFDISNGAIRLDGKSINEFDLYSFRKLFATVQQDVEIFDASLLENIAYPCSSFSDDEIQKALHAAHLTSLTTDEVKFPEGLKTMVGDRGVKLSGGEKQRVGIARAYLALLHGARFLILDEATSSLDSEAEKAIQEMIEELHKEMPITIIAIAHRLSTIQKADVINVIQGGKIIESGTHEDLLNHNGSYAHLVELQQLSTAAT